MAITDYFHTLQVCSITQTVDEYGDTVSQLGAPVEFLGHIGKPSSQAAQHMAQLGIDVTGRLYAQVDAPVKEFSIILEPDTGAAFQVVSEPRDAARRGHHIEADLKTWREVNQ